MQGIRRVCQGASHGSISAWGPVLLQKTIVISIVIFADSRPERIGPADYDARWTWANRQCGLLPPERFSQIVVHRSVHPIAHAPTSVLFNFAAGTDALVAVRSVEMRWGDLVPSDGRRVFWQIIRSHGSLQTNEVLDVTLPHFMIPT